MSATRFVTVTPTICDGTVVRWFASQPAMEHCLPVISASRNGVSGHDTGTCALTPELFAAAWEAHRALARGDDLAHLATHRARHLFGRDYDPVDRP